MNAKLLYALVALIGFLIVVAVVAILKKNGKLSNEQVKAIAEITNGLSTVAGALSDANEGKGAYGVADLVLAFISKSVLAAENAWYNDKIEKEERKAYCLERFNELMDAYEISLTNEQLRTVSTLIDAECEEMGHYLDVAETKDATAE